ncbi:MAG: protein kinase domain-containing protein, partial [Bryobacteraceae bacterium]
MTPERWARIKEVFGAATETTAAERAAYLESACGADSDLRGEVERLLADHATETLASPAAGVLAQVPKLTPGEMLAHYQVEAKLGEGGMGAVYRAYDTQLERQVAVKVLLPDPYADPDRKQRLMREARAASALNHPNIVTVHEIGSDRGVDFIAMEYVDGRSLDKLIPSRGVPVARALDYAIQIADALAKAHATGVVHRDLKPANIMVTAEGRVKLLDFGLARRVALAEGTTASLTVPGTVAGTPAYMSPEQAEGKKTDHRSDVFSFGVVLYEMLTGHRAFAGQTTLALLAAVLHEEPQPVRKIVPAVPRELERLVALCIKKDPARRLQHIDDIAIELQALRDDKAAVEPEAAAPKPRLRVKVASIAALPVLAAVLGLTLWIGRTEKPVTAPELLPLTFDSGLTTQPVISPDGKLLAYASDRGGEGNLDIWVQQMGGSGPIRLTQDTADEHDPDFSPDGTQIAFHSKRAGGGIYVIPALGGEARLVVAPGRAPRFSPDGSQIAYWVGGNVSAARGAAVFVIGTAGGRPQQLSRDFVYGSYPTWATDGNHVLFFGARELHGNLDWWVTPVGGGPAIKAGLMAVLPVRLRSESYERGFRVIDPNAWFHDELIFSDSAPGAPGS